MSGQTMKSKRQIVEEYLERVNPYEDPQPIAFDLRAYTAYVADNGLTANQISQGIMKRFSKA